MVNEKIVEFNHRFFNELFRKCIENGGYFEYDLDDVKLRFEVRNFQIEDSGCRRCNQDYKAIDFWGKIQIIPKDKSANYFTVPKYDYFGMISDNDYKCTCYDETNSQINSPLVKITIEPDWDENLPEDWIFHNYFTPGLIQFGLNNHFHHPIAGNLF